MMGLHFSASSTLAFSGASERRKIVRDLQGLPRVLARHGALELRLATTKSEIRKAQRLRFRVFYSLGHASGNPKSSVLRRDICPFDRFSDHLLIYDTDHHNRLGLRKPKVVGTYRLLRGDVAVDHNGFYSQGEFDLTSLLRANEGQRLLELGRSCVHPKYRSKKVIDLLWKGIGIYARHHRTDILFGCASFPGVDVGLFRGPLSYLYHHARAESSQNARPCDARHVPMDYVPLELLDVRASCALLPPLVKGYLRVGAKFGDAAVVDHRFGTIDVFTILTLRDVPDRYTNRFGQVLGAPTAIHGQAPDA